MVDNESLRLIEESVKVLAAPERTIWTSSDLDPIIDNLVEIWNRISNQAMEEWQSSV